MSEPIKLYFPSYDWWRYSEPDRNELTVSPRSKILSFADHLVRAFNGYTPETVSKRAEVYRKSLHYLFFTGANIVNKNGETLSVESFFEKFHELNKKAKYYFEVTYTDNDKIKRLGYLPFSLCPQEKWICYEVEQLANKQRLITSEDNLSRGTLTQKVLSVFVSE